MPAHTFVPTCRIASSRAVPCLVQLPTWSAIAHATEPPTTLPAGTTTAAGSLNVTEVPVNVTQLPEICSNAGHGFFLPVVHSEADAIPLELRSTLYVMGLLWMLVGIALGSDMLIQAVDTITSAEYIQVVFVNGRDRRFHLKVLPHAMAALLPPVHYPDCPPQHLFASDRCSLTHAHSRARMVQRSCRVVIVGARRPARLLG